VRFPLSLQNVDALLLERGIDIAATVRRRWNRIGPIFAAAIRRQRVSRMHVVDRETCKTVRSAALAEWQSPLG
jgi:transposase-like protein